MFRINTKTGRVVHIKRASEQLGGVDEVYSVGRKDISVIYNAGSCLGFSVYAQSNYGNMTELCFTSEALEALASAWEVARAETKKVHDDLDIGKMFL